MFLYVTISLSQRFVSPASFSFTLSRSKYGDERWWSEQNVDEREREREREIKRKREHDSHGIELEEKMDCE
jgi:hypothetical protein